MTDSATVRPDPALLRHLPAIGKLLHHAAWAGMEAPETLRSLLAREAVDEVREAIAAGTLRDAPTIAHAVEVALRARVDRIRRPSLRPILNGSGVLLHTNAGRAPLPQTARDQVEAVTSGFSNLELNHNGQRGSRQDHCRPLLRWLTGAEDALIVNNGAAAILLALRAVARDRPVIVSRGELVEIGGGFRVPEVMAVSGAQLVEVGTTNRTHLRDYEKALVDLAAAGTPAAAILQVHPSNFAVVGFEKHPPLADLADLAHRHNTLLLVDLGSGALAPLPIVPAALPDGSQPEPEPTVAQIVEQHADLVTFSADKLVGGPQAGLVVGKRALVQATARDPLARAVRVGGLTLAALEPVLQLHLLAKPLALPVLAQLHEPEVTVAERAERWARQLAARAPQLRVSVEPGVTQIGGGTHPLLVLPSRSLAVSIPGLSGAELAQRALSASLAVLGRPRDDRLLLDVRSLTASIGDGQDAVLLDGLAASLQSRTYEKKEPAV